MRPLGIRRRLLILVVAAVAAALAGLIAGFNLLLAHTLDGNVNDVLRADAAAQLDNLETRNGRLVVSEQQDAAAVDSWVWVLSRGRVLEHPTRPPTRSTMPSWSSCAGAAVLKTSRVPT